MPATLIQPSFGKGELSPSLHGRVDLEQYRVGLATALNGYIMPQGGFVSRPGFRHIAVAKEFTAWEWDAATAYVADDTVLYGTDTWVALASSTNVEPGTDSTKWTQLKVRLIPFVFSTVQAYILEFGHKYIRVYKEGGHVLNGGNPVEITTTYTADEIFSLNYCQSADILHLCHPDHAPAKLTRTSHTAWTLSDISFTSPPAWTTGYPALCTFFEQRFVLAASPGKPQQIAMSRSADYYNFNTNTSSGGDPLDDDACVYTIAANQVNAIKWLVPMETLLMGAAGGEWKLTGGSNDVVTPTSISIKPQTKRGAADAPRPLEVGSSVLFLQRQGRVAREFVYTLERDGYIDNDITALADHLLIQDTIVDWSYQQSPRSLVWAAREDGALLGLTYMREHEVVAWHRHITPGGWFESTAAIPGETEDEMWVAVKRTLKFKGWHLAIADTNTDTKADGKIDDTFDIEDGFTFESGCVVSGVTPTGDARWFRYKGSVSVAASGAAKTITFAATPTGDQIEPVHDAGGTLDAANWDELTTATRYRRYVERLAPEHREETSLNAFFMDSGLSYSGAGLAEFSGLEHLEGMSVDVLADAYVQAAKTVTNGLITLDRGAAVVHAGLGYNTDLLTLRMEGGAPDGVSQGRTKAVAALSVLFHRTLGELRIGPDEDQLDIHLFNTDENPIADPIGLYSGYDKISFDSGWGADGRVLIRRTQPLPMTILAIVPTVAVGSAG